MKSYIKYILATVAGIALALSLMFGRELFSATTAEDAYKILCDAFFVPGALILCWGMLMFVSNGGVFDFLSYSMITFFSIFKKDISKRKYHDFYSYKAAQEEKPKSFGFLVVVGLVFLVISTVFLILYCNV